MGTLQTVTMIIGVLQLAQTSGLASELHRHLQMGGQSQPQLKEPLVTSEGSLRSTGTQVENGYSSIPVMQCREEGQSKDYIPKQWWTESPMQLLAK